MLTVQIDKNEVRQIYLNKIEEQLKAVESEKVFWNTKTLQEKTDMSWTEILDKFFYDPRCPKYKVGSRWRFPAAEMKKFLLTWLSEQPKY
ncbi:group-specific protein [Bacillus changyiensis]|uniref:group-specific protein n=1 Tax=Bacillus changyiensis TaxID=3004103 RepID=UPI0022E95F78|nr:group-specific protein [Bacillus changyiensis]MDA1478116.1 group-specific protein [Bacillus changyiensis]